MTKKQYRSAMGKTVDMGALILQNETVRAVGNMGVNARGDILNSANKVIDQKNQQIKRQQKRTTSSVSSVPPVTTPKPPRTTAPVVEEDTFADLPEDNDTVADEVAEPANVLAGGLASAIAKSRTIRQELEKTQRQRQQELSPGVKKI